MVRFTEDDKIYIKILYWGMARSGKTTILDTLYRHTKENEQDIAPTGNLTKISLASGSTLYFDRGMFYSIKPTGFKQVYYHTYTVAGQKRFSPLRNKIFKGTDGVIFTVDSQTHLFQDNIESLKELKNIAKGKLIKEIPLIIMLNKQDLTDVIDREDFKQVLIEENLWFDPENEFSMWNPAIYKTCALYNQRKNIYRSFLECARRINLSRDFDGNGTYPHPYISKPPTPPEDLTLGGHPQSREPINKKDPEYEPYCPYCGSELPEGQSICYVCGKKVI
jgi:GTPase SAR1 family protein